MRIITSFDIFSQKFITCSKNNDCCCVYCSRHLIGFGATARESIKDFWRSYDERKH